MTRFYGYLKASTISVAIAAGAALGALALWSAAGGRLGHAEAAPDPRFTPITFRTGIVSAARFAPDGDTVRQETTLSSGWEQLTTLAWSPAGDEVWFTASRLDDLTTGALRAVSLTGKERVILPSPAVLLSIQDVFSDGRALLSSQQPVQQTAAWPPAIDRVDLTTGRRELWKTIQPADPVGVDSVIRIVITPDGKAYCHDYVRFLSQLFVVEGLK